MQISLFKYEIHVEISLFKSADIFISNRDIYFHWNTDIAILNTDIFILNTGISILNTDISI